MRWDKHSDILSHATCARNERDNAETEQRLRRLTTSRTFTCTPNVSRHCRISCSSCWCFSGSWFSRCHWCRTPYRSAGRFFIRQFHFYTHTQFQTQSFIFLNIVVRLCLVIVNSICIPKFCIFYIAKTGPLRCCLYTARRLQWTAVSCKQSSCNEIRWILKKPSSEVFVKVLSTTGLPVLSQKFACLFLDILNS